MLTVEGLEKTFPSGVRALAAVTLTVARGEIVAVVGSSGCGKTTLLRLIAGLERPSRGRIRVEEEAIDGPHPAVGFVFQEPRLLPWLTVAGNIGFGLGDLSRAERTARVETALDRVGLGDLGRRLPRALSGGQAQRTALARALVAEPKVLLLDEPFSALDAFTRLDLQDHLLDLWADRRPTLLLVTHDVEEALALADRVVVMRPHPGRIAGILPIDLPRPRDRLAPAFEALQYRVLMALDRSRKAPPGEDLAPAAAI